MIEVLREIASCIWLGFYLIRLGLKNIGDQIELGDQGKFEGLGLQIFCLTYKR